MARWAWLRLFPCRFISVSICRRVDSSATLTGFSPRLSAASRMNVDGGMPKEEERATIATRSSSVILTFICAVLLLPRIA